MNATPIMLISGRVPQSSTRIRVPAFQVFRNHAHLDRNAIQVCTRHSACLRSCQGSVMMKSSTPPQKKPGSAFNLPGMGKT